MFGQHLPDHRAQSAHLVTQQGVGFGKDELLAQSFEVFASSQPWVRDFELRPKSVVRDMYERAMSFAEYVSFYQLARSEGLVLRYLSDADRAIRQTVPAA